MVWLGLSCAGDTVPGISETNEARLIQPPQWFEFWDLVAGQALARETQQARPSSGSSASPVDFG